METDVTEPRTTPSETSRQDARERVNAATDEAFRLAMDALHDRAIEDALWKRLENRHPRSARQGASG